MSKSQWIRKLPEGSSEYVGASDCSIRAFANAFCTSYVLMRRIFKDALPEAEFFKDSSKGFTGDEIIKVLTFMKAKYEILYPKKDNLSVRSILALDKNMLIACANTYGNTHLTAAVNGVMLDSDDEYLDYVVDYVIIIKDDDFSFPF